MVCHLPGAKFKDVSEQEQDILKEEGDRPEVMVHIDTNATDRNKDEVLQREFRKLVNLAFCTITCDMYPDGLVSLATLCPLFSNYPICVMITAGNECSL
eukprot:g36753.t1